MSQVTLVSNGLPLPRAPEYVAPLHASSPASLADGSASAQLAIHGYVYLRGLLPREVVLAMRQRYFQRFPASFVKDGDSRRAAFSGLEPEGLPAHRWSVCGVRPSGISCRAGRLHRARTSTAPMSRPMPAIS
jgi:hypothetical protein